MLQDNASKYGVITKLFHWVMAVLVLWQMLKLSDYYLDGEHWVGENLVRYHGSIGLLILALVVLRVIWAISQRKNRPQPIGNKTLVKLGHKTLYLALILAPVTAVLLMLGKGYGLKFFGYQLIARGSTQSDLAASLGGFHGSIAWLLLVLILGHSAMGLWHHFVKKDNSLRKII